MVVGTIVVIFSVSGDLELPLAYIMVVFMIRDFSLGFPLYPNSRFAATGEEVSKPTLAMKNKTKLVGVLLPPQKKRESESPQGVNLS